MMSIDGPTEGHTMVMGKSRCVFFCAGQLLVAPPDRRPDSRPTAFTTMRYINRRSLPLPLLVPFLCLAVQLECYCANQFT